ncbi:MAG: DUF4857 domain-containing protein [Prevotellaceae bacterium]|jgi:hypothetical protein|nr:DUF4857 domain-containing protein [Prevotellaceae bacterium]
MKHPTIIRTVIILAGTLAFAWLIPALAKLATTAPQRYPFVYYSSLAEQFCLSSDGVRSDASGRTYTEAQFDSVMPMLYYRQLSATGALPDSVRGRAVAVPDIKTSSLSIRIHAKETSTPGVGLYIMYESMPRRVNLESPGDVFRLKDTIEFIDAATNTVLEEKSARFAAELAKRGYRYPAQWSHGIMTHRKAYDEGYFSLDAAGELYHIKMVNNRPFVRNTRAASDSLAPVHFAMTPVADRRFYGVLFDAAGAVYILETPHYRLRKLDIPPVDIASDEVLIMGNMFFWTVSIMTPEGRRYYALDNDSLQRVDELYIAAAPDLWRTCSAWLFPAYLTFESRSSSYLAPAWHGTAWTGFAGHLAAAALFAAFARRRRKSAWLHSAYILITGVAGLIAVLLTPSGR